MISLFYVTPVRVINGVLLFYPYLTFLFYCILSGWSDAVVKSWYQSVFFFFPNAETVVSDWCCTCDGFLGLFLLQIVLKQGQ